MTKDEELEQLRAEKMVLCELVRCKDEELQQSHQANQDLREGLKEAIRAIESQQEHIKTLEGLISSKPRAHYQYRVGSCSSESPPVG